jgi:glycosyltransferase involved in cell wall biosynthesis
VKIALVVPGGVDRSGTERVIPCLLWLIERLARDSEVHVFALGQEDRPGEWPLLGARVHDAGARPRRLRTLAALLKEHRRAPFDVVHAWWASGPGTVAAAFGRLKRVPVVLTLPGGDLIALPDIAYGGRLSWRGRLWIRVAIAGADRVVVPSAWMGAQARTLGIETIRIPLGVALDRWPVARPKRREPGDRLRLIHIANLNGVKDQETLLRALANVRDEGLAFEIDMIGLDTLGGAVQRRSRELGLGDRVRFHGFLPQSDTRQWVDRAHLMVLSSRNEGVPIVLPEAAVAGVPTVGTEVGLIADWSPDAACAVPVGHSAALASAIVALSRDEDRRLEIAGEAQRRAVLEDADFTAAQTRALYAELLRSGRPRKKRFD